MKILLSRITSDNVQADGRRAIREEHIDDTGVVINIDYISDANFDATSASNARAIAMSRN